MLQWLLYIWLLMLILMPLQSAYGLPAFPGAEGYGSETPGGRGGRVIAVTHLRDAGPGSLRHALEVETGPRIVVFRVGGTIALSRPIHLREPNSWLTVAGQTAPGDGIQLRNYGLMLSDGAHDIVLRYLRLRPGTADPAKIGGERIDALTLWGNDGSHIHHVIADHVSMTWAIDENANHWGWVTDVTYQWCLFAEAATTHHPEGAHSMGLLVGGDARNTVSVHHSVFAHNHNRNPLLRGHRADFRNNLVYNWGTGGSAQFAENVRVNIVGNHYLPGPDTPDNGIVFWVYSGAQAYLQGNWGPRCPTGCDNETAIGIYRFNPSDRAHTPFTVPPVTTHTTADVKALVLAHAGATRPVRDAVDARIVEEIRQGTGHIGIGSAAAVFRVATSPADTDRDGMPDAWERAHQLNPHDASDRNNDADGDGYTAIDMYLKCCSKM